MVELIDNHVLLPHAPNWKDAPEWQRRWHTQIADGVTGAESRTAMRALPRTTLEWTVTPRSLEERAELEARIKTALKSGMTCAPYWGRASKLAADCSAASVQLEATPWTWAVGDWIFLAMGGTSSTSHHLLYDVRQIESVDGLDLTLSQAVSRTYAAGLHVWPMLFGRLDEEAMAALESWRGEMRLSLSELVPHGNAQVGEIEPTAGDGIGVWQIGSTFVVS